MTDEEQKPLDVIKEHVRNLTDEQEVVLLSRASSTPDIEGNMNYSFMGNANPGSFTILASILLTQFGHEVIEQSEEDVSEFTEETLEAKAFFLGMSAMSDMAKRWVENLQETGLGSTETAEDVASRKRVSDFITDGAGGSEGGNKNVH